MPRITHETVRTWILLSVLLALPAAGPALAGLEISEILADPARDWNADGETDYRDDEWIEVTNTGPGSVELAEYYLRDATGDEAHLKLFGVLPAGASAVFYGHHAVAWQTEVDLTISGFSLNNGGDTVELWLGDPAWPGSTLVDGHTYADHAAEDDRSAGRLQPGGTWALFDGLNPYEGGAEPGSTLCEPSPGIVNACQPLVTSRRASWGCLKGAYR